MLDRLGRRAWVTRLVDDVAVVWCSSHSGLDGRGGGRRRRFDGLRSIQQFGKRRISRVHNEHLLHSAPEQAVDRDLASSDAQYRARPGIHSVVFNTAAIAKDHDHLIFPFGSNDRLQSLHPISKRLHVGLFGCPSEAGALFPRDPCHGDDDDVGLYLENMEGELESVPWRFQPVRAR